MKSEPVYTGTDEVHNIKFTRIFAMSNKFTFKIPPVAKLIDRYQLENDNPWIDPFAGENKKAKYTNDLNPAMPTTHHMDALEFLKMFSGVKPMNGYFDPPYSPRQVQECYNGISRAVHMEDTQGSFYSKIKDEFARILQKDAIVISACWNSGGIGKERGFQILEILDVYHGSWKHDTIVTVERKVR